jgi:scyllo-inositol 2-dehydrogenase (NADP+)
MDKIKVCIIGAGNISNTRHIPALNKVEEAEIIGVLSNKIERARKTAEKNNIANFGSVVDDVEKNVSALKKLDWFNEVEAVVIGVPPHLHYGLVKASLELGKHVLVEKPMMMNKNECDELIALAKKKKKSFYVMHNFQYASKMLKLNEIISSKKYGEIESITEVQFTNHDRRLPEWYNDLPMGLFYDEAAHFIYLLERHAGKLVINNSYAVYDKEKTNQTPITLTVNATAGDTPVTMLLNFHAPVCEWYYIVNFKKRIYFYDFFKDILIALPTDNEHFAGDILRNSFRYTWQYWSQFVANGLKMITGNLLYGHDIVLRSFIKSTKGDKADEYLTAINGSKNVVSINEIINKANSRPE